MVIIAYYQITPFQLTDQFTMDNFNQRINETNIALQNKADKSVDFAVTLSASGWSNNAQTISDSRFVSSGYAYTVAPASGSFADYADAMVYADDVTADGQMVFHCDSTPTADLTVNIVRMVTAE